MNHSILLLGCLCLGHVPPVLLTLPVPESWDEWALQTNDAGVLVFRQYRFPGGPTVTVCWSYPGGMPDGQAWADEDRAMLREARTEAAIVIRRGDPRWVSVNVGRERRLHGDAQDRPD